MQRKILLSIIIFAVFSTLFICGCNNSSEKAESTKKNAATISEQDQTADTNNKTDDQQQNQVGEKKSTEQKTTKQTTNNNDTSQEQSDQKTTTTTGTKSDKSTCTLSVSCASILDHLDSFNKDKIELLPDDGIIFYKTDCEFSSCESVFDVLKREMLAADIHFEFSTTPVYNTNYVEAINNIYEFDGGDFAGWKYKVNGTFPGCGCSLYKLSDGDVIEWIYSFSV